MINKMKRALTVLWFGLLTLRYAGLWVALKKLAHQLYGRSIFYGTIKILDEPPESYTFKCYVTLASAEDIDKLFSNVNTKNGDEKYQLLVRKWYHERGFGDCYVTKVEDKSEICATRWVVTKKHLKEMGWENRFSKLQEDEILLENIYVLEQYRRMGVQTSGSHHMFKICRDRGFKYAKGWIADDNVPELYACQKHNWLAFEKVLERHILFHVTRKVLESYNPPISVPIPQQN
jgi:hypothetical protein